MLRLWQVIPGTDNYRFNYWGYSTVGFFAPMARYSAAAGTGQPASEVVREFKTLVKECHKRGIEVILDVVFNHTAEGNQNGPSLSFRQALVRPVGVCASLCQLMNPYLHHQFRKLQGEPSV